MFDLRYLSGVATLTLDADNCDGCGMCVTVCPHSVFAVEHGKSRIVDGDACMECGACAKNCPTEAIGVRSGVGCAAAVIAGGLRRSDSDSECSEGPCCCQPPSPRE